jgi:hypothetical protein
MHNLDVSDLEDWLVVGDFNLIKCLENKPGGSATDMLMFNDLI